MQGTLFGVVPVSCYRKYGATSGVLHGIHLALLHIKASLTLGYVLVDRVAIWSRKHQINGAIHGGRAYAYVIEDEYGDQVVKTAYQCNQAAAYARLLLQKEAGKLG